MAYLGILILSVGAACLYGVLHDLVTANVCVEYFTIGHPPLLPTTSPFLLALGWGVVATWWMGVLLGIPLATAARAGAWPRMSASDLLRPLAFVLVSMGVAAALWGLAGYGLASLGWVRLPQSIQAGVPSQAHVRFLAVWWAHQTSYVAGTLGGIGLCVWTIVRRGQRAVEAARAGRDVA